MPDVEILPPGTIMPSKSMPRKSKVERVGAAQKVVDLVCETDLTHQKIAERINRELNLEEEKLKASDIYNFLAWSYDAFLSIEERKTQTMMIRAHLQMNKDIIICQDLKKLDEAIKLAENDVKADGAQKANAIANCIEKKAKLLFIHARLTGAIKQPSSKVYNSFSKTEIVIHNQTQDLELIARISKAPAP